MQSQGKNGRHDRSKLLNVLGDLLLVIQNSLFVFSALFSSFAHVLYDQCSDRGRT